MWWVTETYEGKSRVNIMNRTSRTKFGYLAVYYTIPVTHHFCFAFTPFVNYFKTADLVNKYEKTCNAFWNSM